ncbi:signal peptidase I [Cereibacter changlensis]|uniref:Signal peptidase I n=1 Tax=Cereibacter changlensis TaxID=402884 RepID=A0A4U0Z790_9RHOB|nr:S26 family signal peptidase [Cereibacter changlensis]TKA98394.1 signal peptidase I [Cereibacter changlensis]
MTAIQSAKWGVILAGSLFVMAGFWALHTVRITLNGSSSLPDHAYVMWGWPKAIWRGAYIAAEPPEVYAERFRGFFFTKEVFGLPGDIISHDGAGAVCVRGSCFPLALKDGKPFAPALAEGVIPEGRYAAFGTSADSLDSRYAHIGLFPIERIAAVGVAANIIPHWKELKAWADARGLR